MAQIQRSQTYPTITIEKDILNAPNSKQYQYIRNLANRKLLPGQKTYVNVIVSPEVISLSTPSYVGVIELSKDLDGNFIEKIDSIGKIAKAFKSLLPTSNDYIVDLFAPDSGSVQPQTVSVKIDSGLYPTPPENVNYLTPQGVSNVPITTIIPKAFKPGKEFIQIPELYWFEDLLFVGLSIEGYMYKASGFREETYEWIGLESVDRGAKAFGLGSLLGSDALPLEYGVLSPGKDRGSRVRCEAYIYETNERLEDYIPHTGYGGLWRIDNQTTPYAGNSATFSYAKSFTVFSYYWLSPYREEFSRQSRYSPLNAYKSREIEGSSWYYEQQEVSYYFAPKNDIFLSEHLPGFPPYQVDGGVFLPVFPVPVLLGGLAISIPSGLTMSNIRLNAYSNSKHNVRGGL